tara:strand:- start:630 stop:743 length:114 start_codon:yes stop_codon:yes gene_type:complete
LREAEVGVVTEVQVVLEDIETLTAARLLVEVLLPKLH